MTQRPGRPESFSDPQADPIGDFLYRMLHERLAGDLRAVLATKGSPAATWALEHP